MDSVLEDIYENKDLLPCLNVSILVSVDSVLEVLILPVVIVSPTSFNPSFCGFGIGGNI